MITSNFVCFRSRSRTRLSTYLVHKVSLVSPIPSDILQFDITLDSKLRLQLYELDGFPNQATSPAETRRTFSNGHDLPACSTNFNLLPESRSVRALELLNASSAWLGTSSEPKCSQLLLGNGCRVCFSIQARDTIRQRTFLDLSSIRHPSNLALQERSLRSVQPVKPTVLHT